jgi:hypothetical protein
MMMYYNQLYVEIINNECMYTADLYQTSKYTFVYT